MIKYYLGEEPIIPNVPSYLCMRDQDRDYVLQNLDKLVVKPANESGGYGMLVGPHAKAEERKRFATLIQEQPRNYMAQPTLTLSTAPTLCVQTVEPRHLELLRFHTAAQHASHVSYHVEPRHLDLRPFILSGADTYVTTGGLTRVALKRGSLVVNSSQGEAAKTPGSWIPRNKVMLSRVAQNIYWLSRYIERVEDTARLISVNTNLLLDLPRDTAFGWQPLLFIIGNQDEFYKRYQQPDEVSVVKFLVGDQDNAGSILSSLSFARENLRTTRDVVPREAWEQVNDLYMYVRDHLEMACRGGAAMSSYGGLSMALSRSRVCWPAP